MSCAVCINIYVYHALKIHTLSRFPSRGPMYWPHEVLAYLWEKVAVEVPRDKRLQYWEEARERCLPWADGSEGDTPKIPLKLRGDDASYGYGKQNDKFMAFVISSPLWRPHASRNSRWTVAVLNLHFALATLPYSRSSGH